MRRKGSVTLFFSLLLAVILVLVQTVFHSVQIAGGKVQAEAGADEGLYSVFAGYDRELFEKYHVFFLDGGYGTETFQPGRMYQTIENSLAASCNPGKNIMGIRGENLWKISKASGAVTDITLASDQQGRAFKLQAIDYMKDTAGIQGIQFLLEKSGIQEQIVREQEKEGTLEKAKDAGKAYEQAQKQAMQNSADKSSASQSDGSSGTQGVGSSGETQVFVPDNFVNPLEVIKQLRTRGILSLVLPMNTEISQAGFGSQTPVSRRNLESGMGILRYGDNPDTVMGNLIFQEYMAAHLTSYLSQETDPGIRYQLEYVIAGKDTDQENLKSVVKRLLAMREAANLAYLLKDPSSQARIHEMSLLICSAIGLPALEGIVSLALEAAWAFGESVLDVRQLLAGGKIPLIKTTGSWILSLENLGRLPELLKQGTGRQQKGLSYQEYLRILLGMGTPRQQVLRTMDVVEQTVRAMEGKENFRMDLCVSYMQVEMEMVCGGYQFSMLREYGYEM